jgi:nucleoid DNA-binding protein
MSGLKTKVNSTSVSAFLESVGNEQRRKDASELVTLMKEVTGKRPKMWGTSLVGFGSYHYRYQSGREGDWPVTGFSPRAQNLSVYVMPGFAHYGALMDKLGKYKTGKSCLYLKRLDDVDRKVLKRLVARSVADMKKRYDCS